MLVVPVPIALCLRSVLSPTPHTNAPRLPPPPPHITSQMLLKQQPLSSCERVGGGLSVCLSVWSGLVCLTLIERSETASLLPKHSLTPRRRRRHRHRRYSLRRYPHGSHRRPELGSAGPFSPLCYRRTHETPPRRCRCRSRRRRRRPRARRRRGGAAGVGRRGCCRLRVLSPRRRRTVAAWARPRCRGSKRAVSRAAAAAPAWNESTHQTDRRRRLLLLAPAGRRFLELSRRMNEERRQDANRHLLRCRCRCR
jgi:hypothetical protein